MAERTAGEIAAAQLNHDVAEAKARASDWLGSNFVDAIENLIAKVVMRWWFARIQKNKAAYALEDPKVVEEHRRIRAVNYIAMAETINAKASGGKPPDNRQLQISLLDDACNFAAIWQALIDAAIISPDGKQQYLDRAVAELAQRVANYAGKIDLGQPDPAKLARRGPRH